MNPAVPPLPTRPDATVIPVPMVAAVSDNAVGHAIPIVIPVRTVINLPLVAPDISKLGHLPNLVLVEKYLEFAINVLIAVLQDQEEGKVEKILQLVSVQLRH